MRTKTLLLAVAALAASMAISKAQPVYSANVVGYVNVTNSGGGNYTLVANPLDYDGTGTNNTVQNLLGTNLPVGSIIETWSPVTGFSGNSYNALKGGGGSWQHPNNQLPPGQGFFIYNPSGSTTNTFVGTVEQGGLTNQVLTGAGYNLIGGNFPVQGGITTTYGYAPSVTDQVLTWSPSAGYTGNSYNALKGGGGSWQHGEPQIGPGVGVFLFTTNQNPVMGTNFVVQ